MKKNFKITRRNSTYRNVICSLANIRYDLCMSGYNDKDSHLRPAYYLAADLFNKKFERVIDDTVAEMESICKRSKKRPE